MTTPAIPLKEFDVEMATTRKLLERVPGDKGAWKPHQKSFSLGHLAQLVAGMPGWIGPTLREPHIDLAKSGGYSLQSTDELLKIFDANVQDARAALQSVTGAALGEPWSLKHGDRVLMTMVNGRPKISSNSSRPGRSCGSAIASRSIPSWSGRGTNGCRCINSTGII